MSYAVAILIMLAAATAGGLLSLFVQARIQAAHRKAHQEYGAVVFLQLGVVFAVLLAFVFNSCWEGYNDAQQAIDLECAALHGASMIASALPPPDARRILDLEIRYVEDVVRLEWPIMRRDRDESVPTDNALVRLVSSVAAIDVDAGAQNAARDEIQRLVAEAHAQRAQRIFQADSGVPSALWAVLIAFTVVLVAFVSMSALEQKAVSVAFTATFAAATTSILVLAHLLDYPFEGALKIGPQDFATVLVKLEGLRQTIGG